MTSEWFDREAAARLARELVRTARDAALATVDERGRPHVSHVATATLGDGAPVVLVSDLAVHTRHLNAHADASLLFVAPSGDTDTDTNTRARLTLSGPVAPVPQDTEARGRFLRRHPDAALYIDFADFSLRAMAVERAYLVAGFGRITTLPPATILDDAAAAATLTELDEGACAHMDEDHADALALIAQLAGGTGNGWRAVGVDPRGIDVGCGTTIVRAEFDRQVREAGELRVALKRLTDRARDGDAGAVSPEPSERP